MRVLKKEATGQTVSRQYSAVLTMKQMVQTSLLKTNQLNKIVNSGAEAIASYCMSNNMRTNACFEVPESQFVESKAAEI